MRLQYGVNFGDVMVDGNNLLGDSVNVVARLEGLAQCTDCRLEGRSRCH